MPITSCCPAAGHRFPMGKYQLLRDQIARTSPGAAACRPLPARRWRAGPGPRPRLHRCRAAWHGLSAAAARDRLSLERGMASARAARWAPPCRPAAWPFGEGVAANLAGGTHHAYADKGGGFCVFNDAAVAARLMQAEQARRHRPAPRPACGWLVIDLDVHQGNGTARIFQNDPSVFTLSLHGAKNFPVPQGGQRPRRRPARRLHATTPYLPRWSSAWTEAGAPAASPAGDLPGRRRPARRRSPGAPEADLGRPGGARPPRVRLGLAAARAPGLCHGGWLWQTAWKTRCRCRSTPFAWRWSIGGAGRIAARAMNDPKPAKPQPEPRSGYRCFAPSAPAGWTTMPTATSTTSCTTAGSTRRSTPT
jgi:hypothetical protein